MSSLQEIERAIEQLPRDKAFALSDWLRQRLEAEWDKEFEDDVAAGRLDAVGQQALREHRAGNSTDFPGDEK